MKAAVLTAPEVIELREVAEPSASGDVLVRIRSVGICGTDRKIFSGAIPVAYPRVMGHEMSGEVLERDYAGEPSSGTRVLIDPGITCGSCRQCREGRPNICTGGGLLGRDRDGGLVEVLRVPASNLHPLPDSISDAEAPVLQVLATCVHAQRLVQVFPDEAVVIIGMGVTGLLHLQLAAANGARPIVCVSRSEEKLSLAASLGADVSIRADGDEVSAVLDVTDGGADVAIECVGTVPTLAGSIGMVRVGGRILSYGTVTGEASSFPFYDLYFKEIVLTSPRSASPEDFPASIQAAASGQVRLDPLVSKRLPLAATRDALGLAGASASLKVIVELAGSLSDS